MPLQESWNSGDTSYANIYSIIWGCQTFTAGSAYDISSVKLLVFRTGNPGTVDVELLATDGDGKPTGAALASGSFAGSTLTTDTAGEWKEITFGSAYSLTSGNVYAIVVSAPSGAGGNWLGWRTDGSAPVYSDGEKGTSTNSGSSWSMSGSFTALFETWGEVPAVYAECAGTCAATGAASGGLGFTATFITNTNIYRRLVAAGNNQIWYEDI